MDGISTLQSLLPMAELIYRVQEKCLWDMKPLSGTFFFPNEKPQIFQAIEEK
jgi:hypothetical protein